jgi:cob(I)alamin adenosyltransferase
MRIYTRRGDDGSTGLFGGPRVGKDDLRVAAYGDVDELNAALGVARGELVDSRVADLERFAAGLQSELFDLGAELATPDRTAVKHAVPQATAEDVARLEGEIDRIDDELPELRAFVLPAGTRAAAALHVCRTVCRRAERSLVLLSRKEQVSTEALAYLNRLSDLLFTMARAANLRLGVQDVPWQPKTARICWQRSQARRAAQRRAADVADAQALRPARAGTGKLGAVPDRRAPRRLRAAQRRRRDLCLRQ